MLPYRPPRIPVICQASAGALFTVAVPPPFGYPASALPLVAVPPSPRTTVICIACCFRSLLSPYRLPVSPLCVCLVAAPPLWIRYPCSFLLPLSLFLPYRLALSPVICIASRARSHYYHRAPPPRPEIPGICIAHASALSIVAVQSFRIPDICKASVGAFFIVAVPYPFGSPLSV